ncbi:MAG: hypothetical protein AAF799_23015 [Myxococcota bacterium]
MGARVLALVGLAVVLSACAWNRPYRMEGSPEEGWTIAEPTPVELTGNPCAMAPPEPDKRGESCGDAFAAKNRRRDRRDDDLGRTVEWVQRGGEDLYKLGFVEIDDHGNAFDPRQLQTSLKALEPTDGAGVIMVTYVHGWHHDSHPNDSDVVKMRCMLINLAADEAQRVAREGGTPRQVRGMYVGWRGRSYRGRSIFTFWARKRGAHRVGERSAVSVLTRIQRFAERVTVAAPESSFVTIGHSFGAAVVHSALEATLVPELAVAADAASRGEPVPMVHGLGQITVLLNPAFEAGRYRHARELAQEIAANGGFHPKQKPVLLMLTTNKDWMTQTPFTMGMRVRGHRGKFIKDARGDEKKEYLTAVGHYTDYHEPGVGIECVSGDALETSARAAAHAHAFETPSKRCWIDGWERAPTPLMSVYDKGQVMCGHNDVFNSTLLTLLTDFVMDIDAPPIVDRPVPPRTTVVEAPPEPLSATPPVEPSLEPTTPSEPPPSASPAEAISPPED